MQINLKAYKVKFIPSAYKNHKILLVIKKNSFKQNVMHLDGADEVGNSRAYVVPRVYEAFYSGLVS